ncbi:MAG TPA: hypothetical protein VMA34_21135 [Terracidiphilus sp.]|nr:hypothetical protein [Terracidiphilus sp.]
MPVDPDTQPPVFEATAAEESLPKYSLAASLHAALKSNAPPSAEAIRLCASLDIARSALMLGFPFHVPRTGENESFHEHGPTLSSLWFRSRPNGERK